MTQKTVISPEPWIVIESGPEESIMDITKKSVWNHLLLIFSLPTGLSENEQRALTANSNAALDAAIHDLEIQIESAIMMISLFAKADDWTKEKLNQDLLRLRSEYKWVRLLRWRRESLSSDKSWAWAKELGEHFQIDTNDQNGINNKIAA